MAKKMSRNKRSRPIHKRQNLQVMHYRIIVIASLVIIFGGGFVFAIHRTFETHVLGTHTFLAEGGSSGRGEHSEESGGTDRLIPSQPAQAPSVSGMDIMEKHENVQELLLHKNSGGRRDSSPEAEVEHTGEPHFAPRGQPEITIHQEADDITVASHGAQGFMVRQRQTGVQVPFPVTIDKQSNTLQVDTPSGKQTVVVLPEAAVRNALAANAISSLSATASEQSLRLETKDGQLIYHMHGDARQKFLGIIPVTIGKDVRVSAQTGSVDTQNESFGASVLDFFSF